MAGEDTVLLTKDGEDGIPGKLKEVLDPKVYCHNSEALVRKNPEIERSFQKDRMALYMGKECAHSQMFLGRQGTGSPIHNASSHNFFYMVDGSKQWYLIDPYDIYLACPLMNLGYTAGVFLSLYPDEYPEELMPAFK